MNTYKSCWSQQTNAKRAAEEVTRAISAQNPPSLACVFASTHYRRELPHLARLVCKGLDTKNVIGCLADPIIQHDDEPRVSIWAAWWPTATVELRHVRYVRHEASFTSLPSAPQNQHAAVLMLADSYSFPADVLFADWNERHPGLSVCGGLTEGAMLMIGEQIVEEGAVLAALNGVSVTNVVSQGCRPIGDPFVITKAERNVILELGGKPAYDQLQSVHNRLPTRDKNLVRQGLQFGRVINECQATFDSGDFLIRDVQDVDPEDGSLTVSDYYRVGQTVQFHVRDAESASQELETLLRSLDDRTPKAALLFAGNGRDAQMFEHSAHDANMVRQTFGSIPCAGCFCDGEVGPVGGQNFVHGFSASVSLFA